MTDLKKFGISILLILAIVLFWFYTINDKRNPDVVVPKIVIKEKTRNDKTNSTEILSNNKKLKVGNEINIASVICGGKNRARFALPLLKSAILFSETNLNIHLFTDIATGEELKLIYSNFTDAIKRRVKFIFYNASFPTENKQYWKNLYKSCATQRIFYPNILTDVNEIIHFDADTIIVTKLENIWQKFKEISQTEMLGAVNDCRIPGCAYYHRSRPVVGRFGINSGFLFMKLDDLRKFNFVNKIIEITNSKKYIIISDQDLINILFNNQTDLIKLFDCTYNYFPSVYCDNIDQCDLSEGIKIVHGVNGFFEKSKDNVFHILVNKLIEIDLNKDRFEAIKEIISHVDNYDDTDKCIVSKSFIFNEYRNETLTHSK